PASSGARLSGVPSEPASWRSDSREGRCGGVGAFDRPVGLKLAFFGEKNGRNETGHRTLTENLGTLCWPYVQTGCAGSIERMRDVIVNSCNTLEEVEDPVGEVSEKLTHAVHAYWLAAHPN